jgi:hypothetical protein
VNFSLSSPKGGLEPLGKRRKEFANGKGPLRAEQAGASESLGWGEEAVLSGPSPPSLTDYGFGHIRVASGPALARFRLTYEQEQSPVYLHIRNQFSTLSLDRLLIPRSETIRGSKTKSSGQSSHHSPLPARSDVESGSAGCYHRAAA